jgi:hypothetical protein
MHVSTAAGYSQKQANSNSIYEFTVATNRMHVKIAVRDSQMLLTQDPLTTSHW